MKTYDNGDFETIEDERSYYEHIDDYNEWLTWYHDVEHSRFNHTDTTVDCIMLTYDRSEQDVTKRLKVLLIQRWTQPFMNTWCLPGTFMNTSDKDAVATIARMLASRLNFDVSGAKVMQLKTFTGCNRDPRGQVISISHLVFIHDGVEAVHNADIDGKRGLKWVPLIQAADMSNLGFDHAEQLNEAIIRLQNQFAWQPNIFMSLPVEFTIDDAIAVKCSLFADDDYENKMLAGKAKDNFKKKYKKLFREIGVIDDSNPLSPKLYSLKNPNNMTL